MYYRYKTRKKRSKIIKYLLIIILLSLSASAGYKYRKYLYFWKYSYNKLFEQIDKTAKIKDITRKRSELNHLTEILKRYRDENPLNADAFLISGKVHFDLGKTYLQGSFTELFINDFLNTINSKALLEFTKAIKFIKKGIALNEDGEISQEYAAILAWSCFYCRFNEPDRILMILEQIRSKSELNSIDDIRLFSVINICTGKEDQGIRYLKEKGRTEESIPGKLFLAKSQMLAKQYTDSIMNFKSALAHTKNSKILKLIYFNLGKIYFKQSLFNESLSYFYKGLEIDGKDNELRIWIGKNYSATGDLEKAKAIWNKVLVTDRTNSEVKKLLDVM